MPHLLAQLAIIGAAGIAAQWVGWRLRLPAIVFLLIFGFLLGPVMGLVEPRALMGDLLRPAVSAAVAIILFEASLQLRIRELRDVRKAVLRIVLIGSPLGWVLIALSAHFLAGLSWPVAVTFGGILVVTGPTVIMPMLRHSRLRPRVGSVLKWEGIINDPLGVIFAVLAYEYFHFQHTAAKNLGAGFYTHHAAIIGLVITVSFFVGRVTAVLLDRGYVPEFLKSAFLIASVLVMMSASNLLLHESGLMAVTIYGMTLANARVASIAEIRRFKETITILLVSGVFVMLTADLDISALLDIDRRGLLFILALVFILRPLTIIIASAGTFLNWKERLLVGWIAPRGIICAAIAGVMGPLLTEAGYQDGAKILPLAFGIVVATVLLHGLTLKPLAHRLGLAASRAGGVIIVGASDWTIQLAEALMARDVPVIITDVNWHHLKPARLASIPVYYGEVLSEETEYNLELNRYGALLAATDNSAYNTLVCNAFAPDLGRENVYQISSGEEAEPERKKLSNTLQGRVFVDRKIDYTGWWHRFFNNYRFKITSRKPDDSKDDIKDRDGLIGTISKSGMLTFKTPELPLSPKEDDGLLVFQPDEKVKEKTRKQAGQRR